MPSAARICLDLHVSPSSSGSPAPILPPGSPDVIIGKMPAARANDKLTSASGPPDVILKGSSSVFINGLPAARMGDPTGSGGTLTTGDITVIIGG